LAKASITSQAEIGNKKKAAEVHSLLEALITRREREIEEMEQMVDRYERRLRKEEQAYRTFSPLRRMLSGKKPDHHLAVEYIHYIKKPMEKVRLLREENERYRAMLNGSVPAELPETYL
jgi:acetyl-CoA carboxylase alpha subunit